WGATRSGTLTANNYREYDMGLSFKTGYKVAPVITSWTTGGTCSHNQVFEVRAATPEDLATLARLHIKADFTPTHPSQPPESLPQLVGQGTDSCFGSAEPYFAFRNK